MSRRAALAAPMALVPSVRARKPGRLRTLEPSDPVALELDRLYRELLASHGPEHAAYRACEDRGDYLWENDLPGRKTGEIDPESKRLHGEHDRRERARRTAYFALLHAVVEAAGGPDLDEARWMRYGCPLHALRVGDRVYSVCADSDSDYDPGVGCYGLAEVTVIEL